MDPQPVTIAARWLFPVSRPPVANGSITILGDRIVSVDPSGIRDVDWEFPDCALIPGLVNCHTHLDLTGARGQLPPTPADRFPDWLRSVIAFRRSRSTAEIADDVVTGLKESLRFGVTLLGDISSTGVSWSVVSQAPVRAVIFRELLGLSDSRVSEAIDTARQWLTEHPATSRCRPGLSPHAPYSASVWLFLRAVSGSVPVATHLAESAAEVELLERRSGPFVPFLEELGVWNPEAMAVSVGEFVILAEGVRAKRMSSQGPEMPPLLWIHGNYLSTDLPLQSAHQSVIYCPRTHAAFEHDAYPLRELLAKGVRVAVGTDSLASNPDLDLFRELQFLRENDRSLPGDMLLRLGTLSGAEALGWENECGSLCPGKSADLVLIPLKGQEPADPYDWLFRPETVAAPRRTMFQGVWRDQP
jgi:cytosine/adenosine deaminase-related metal-dependent hydrolase